MKVLFDLNVILDVVEDREPFVRQSATAMGRVVSTPRSKLYLAAHGAPTLFYILRRHHGADVARKALGKMLANFEVLPASKAILTQALEVQCDDYGDAVSFLSAEKARCDFIVTRNVADFVLSKVPAVTPEEFLTRPDVRRLN